MRKNKLLLLLALLMTAATGAWAAEVTVTKTVHDLFPSVTNGTQEATLYSDANLSISVNTDGNNGKVYSNGTEWRIYQTNSAVVTVTATDATIKSVAFTFTVKNTGIIKYDGNAMTSGTAVSVNAASAQFVVGNSGTANNGQVIISGFTVVYETAGGSGGSGDETYSVTMKDGVKDADKWTITPNEGLKEGDAVTLTYSGRLKVKGVKATVEAPAEATPALSITSPSVGQVIGSDGKNYAYGSVPSGVTAVAKICYVSGSNGLALALTDEEGTMEWRPAIETIAAHTAPFTGGMWKVASKDEWSNMITAAGSYTALRDGFTSVGGTNMQSNYYWTSTEWDSNGAWSYDFSNGYWASDPMDFDSCVRACLAFTVEQGAGKTAATVTTAPTGAAIVGVGKTTELVSGGVADGGKLMYAVTTTNTKPTSTAGFSDAVPTAKDITASGKVYVWYYVKGDGTHSDSEIAATAIEVPVAIIWDVTNVGDLAVDGYGNSYEKEGVTLSGNDGDVYALWIDNGDPTTDGIAFQAYEAVGYTFTAPAGKAFTKIEMKPVGYDSWDEANLGTGWAYNNSTVTWTGTAASTVKLLTGTDYFEGAFVKSIVFYLSE